MKSVSHIFGGEAKVKIMRLFIFNPTEAFDLDAIVERAKEGRGIVRKEIAALSKAGLIKRKSYIKLLKGKKGKVPKRISKRAYGFILNPEYPYLSPLEHFL